MRKSNVADGRVCRQRVYFRMLLVGYFEEIGFERGIAWRCGDTGGIRLNRLRGLIDVSQRSLMVVAGHNLSRTLRH